MYLPFNTDQSEPGKPLMWHPDSERVDALSLPWGAENNWLFPPAHLVGAAVTQLRACRAVATLVCPHYPWAAWCSCLRAGSGWACDIVAVEMLGPPRPLLKSRGGIAVSSGSAP